jgi:hypothetical protein
MCWWWKRDKSEPGSKLTKQEIEADDDERETEELIALDII